MKAKILLLLISAGFAAVALAQDSATMLPPNTVYVGADGKYEADPDTALLRDLAGYVTSGALCPVDIASAIRRSAGAAFSASTSSP